jgi:hypothetical protein
MKKFAVGLLLLAGLSLQLRAQVTVELVLDQENFLIGESIPAAVRITNRSGQSLRLGEDADWLTFAMEARKGPPLLKKGNPPVQGAFTVETGQIATRRVELAPYFQLDQLGWYQVTAQVRISDWDRAFLTPPKSFYLVNGARIWSQEFGLPRPPGVTNRAPEVRRYTLEQVSYLRTNMRLYVRLTDDHDQVLRVFPLGPIVSISNPDPKIDRANRLHVLYQHSARSYLYFVISPDGELLRRETHDITGSRPRLQVDEQGEFFISGGARRYLPSDLPAPESTASNVLPESP